MDFKNQVDKTMHFVQKKGVEVAGALHTAYKMGKMFAAAVVPLIL